MIDLYVKVAQVIQGWQTGKVGEIATAFEKKGQCVAGSDNKHTELSFNKS